MITLYPASGSLCILSIWVSLVLVTMYHPVSSDDAPPRAQARAEHAAAEADVQPENGDNAAEADVFHPTHADVAVQAAVLPPSNDVCCANS